ncbi:MAG: hypothetical protein DBY28_04335 [Subdoligranulum sp.]|nr:MAG: hypothetical protein DBY28_04335 [Subdoligranulum sp.]
MFENEQIPVCFAKYSIKYIVRCQTIFPAENSISHKFQPLAPSCQIAFQNVKITPENNRFTPEIFTENAVRAVADGVFAV